MLLKNIGKNLEFIDETKAHNNFLYSLYASNREDELNMSPMSNLEKKLFLEQQFELRQKDYHSKYGDAEFLIIRRKKKDIGRLVYRIKDKLYLIDIALVKKSRSSGFGKEILNSFISFAKENKKSFQLSVAMDNQKAIKLYQNMGLKMCGQNGYYYTMEIKND